MFLSSRKQKNLGQKTEDLQYSFAHFSAHLNIPLKAAMAGRVNPDLPREQLFTYTELCNKAAISFDILLLKVCEKAAPASDHFEQAAA